MLLRYTTRSNNHFLAQKASEIEKSTGISRNWWIGLQKFGQSWIWQYSLEPARYTNWSENEPFPTEHFACLYKDYGYSWRSSTISLINVWPICQVVSSHVYLLTTFISITLISIIPSFRRVSY